MSRTRSTNKASLRRLVTVINNSTDYLRRRIDADSEELRRAAQRDQHLQDQVDSLKATVAEHTSQLSEIKAALEAGFGTK